MGRRADAVPRVSSLLTADEREGRTPFIHGARQGPARCAGSRVSPEIVRLAEERQQFWSQLRQLAGLEIAPVGARRGGAELARGGVRGASSRALRAEYEAKLARPQGQYPAQIARRLAEGLLRTAGGSAAVAELLASLPAAPAARDGSGERRARAPAPAVAPPRRPRRRAGAAGGRRRHRRRLRRPPTASPWPTTTRRSCSRRTSTRRAAPRCNECTNLNKKMFAYNADKQAYIKDADRRHLPAAGARGRALPGVDHPSGHAAQPQGEGPREVGRSAPRSSTELAMTLSLGFRHGVHPPEEKELTSAAPDPAHAVSRRDRAAAAAARGQAGHAVREGRATTSSAAITVGNADGFMSVPIHASAAGTVTDIDWWPHPDGSMAQAVRIAVDRYAPQVPRPRLVPHWEGLTTEQVVRAVQDAGVVGLGGAAFPTHVKLAPPQGSSPSTR